MRGAQDAVAAVRETSDLWLPSVLAEIRGQAGPDLVTPYAVEYPTTIEAAASFAQYPALAVASTGLAGTPVRDARGNWSASYEVTMRLVDRGDSYDDTAVRLRWWAVALRTAVLQQLRRGGYDVIAVRWVDEGYQVVDVDSSRTLGGVDVSFEIDLGAVTNERAGAPTLPGDPAIPTVPPPLVATTAVTIERKDHS